MPDIEKVLKGLECEEYTNCPECPYVKFGKCKELLMRDARELLKKQEAKEVIHPYFKACSKGESLYGTCPECRHRIIEKSNFCGNCGQAVIWTKEGVSRNE